MPEKIYHVYITDPKLWRLAKIEAAKQGITLQKAVLQALQLWLDSKDVKNSWAHNVVYSVKK